MTERVYPKNCHTLYGKEPMTEADWDRYFEYRKTQDIPMTNSEAIAIIDAHEDEFHYEGGVAATKKYKIPLKPRFAIAMKYDLGMKVVMEYNLSEAKKSYPDEF